MKTKTTGIIKKIICWMLGFVLSMALAAGILLVSINFGFFRDRVFLDAMSDMNYYEELAGQLQEDLELAVSVYHIPEQAVSGVIQAEQVYLDGYANLTCAMKGEDYAADVTHVTQDLEERLDVYANERGIHVERAVGIASESIIHAISEEYAQMLTFPFANAYYRAKQQYNRLAVWIGAICAIAILVCTVLLLVLHKKRYHGMREIDHAVLAALLMTGVAGSFVAQEIMQMDILHEQNAYAQMIRNYFSEALHKGIWSLVAGVAVWLALLAATNELRQKKI